MDVVSPLRSADTRWIADDFSASDPENFTFEIVSTFSGAGGAMGAPFWGLSWQGLACWSTASPASTTSAVGERKPSSSWFLILWAKIFEASFCSFGNLRIMAYWSMSHPRCSKRGQRETAVEFPVPDLENVVLQHACGSCENANELFLWSRVVVSGNPHKDDSF